MTYEPLHHKYRPQSFAELVGQQAIATTLSNALQQQRIAPAYLFTGPRGTGKTSSARILAKSLNCIASDAPTPSPCGTCETCREIVKGAALDVIEIDAASNTGVDNIRELIERAQFAPVCCRYKVYVIDEVHMLSVAAFNALLKTLEEPPDRVVFILATTDPQKVLPTIISRCQRFDFRRIDLQEMVNHLGTIAQTEGIPIAPDAVQVVAQISQGGLRDAESLLDQLSLLEGEITVEKVWDLVGAVPERDLLALLKAIAQDDVAAVLDQARHLMNRGREPLIVLQNLASFYRDLLIAKTSPDRGDLVALTPPTWGELCEFARSLDISVIQAGQRYLRESEVQVKNTTQPRLWLEVILMGLLPSAIAVQPASVPVTVPATGNRQPTGSPSNGQQSHPQNANGQPAVARTNGNAAPAKPEVARPQPAVAPDPPDPEPTPAAQPIAEAEPVTPSTAAQPPEPERSEAPVEQQPTVAAPLPEPPTERESQYDLTEVWRSVLGLIQPYSTQIMLRQQCHLIAFNGQEARLGISSQPLFRMAKERLPNVEAAFHQCFEQSIRVSLEVTAQKPSPPVASETPSSYGSTQPSQNQGIQPVHQAPVKKVHMGDRPTPSYQPSNPVPEAAPSVTVGAPQAGAPAEPSPLGQVEWQEEDEVMRAVKLFAPMFNGVIVTDGDSSVIPATAALSLEASGDVDEPDSDADDDVPF